MGGTKKALLIGTGWLVGVLSYGNDKAMIKELPAALVGMLIIVVVGVAIDQYGKRYSSKRSK